MQIESLRTKLSEFDVSANEIEEGKERVEKEVRERASFENQTLSFILANEIETVGNNLKRILPRKADRERT